MKQLKIELFNFVLVFGILLVGSFSAFSQTTISNIPSTDTIEPQSAYAEVSFGAHFDKYSNGGFQGYGVKFLYGLRRNVEIGANVSYTKTGEVSPVEFVPNIKWKAYFNEKHKITVSGGAVAFIPVRAEAGSRSQAMIYANTSKSFDFAKGFRLTGGVYQMVNAKADNGNRKGFMLGYEQTLFKEVSLFADHVSGKNRFGYTAVTLSIPFSKKNVLYTGYNFGNSGRGNNYLSVTFGRYF